MPRDFAAVAVAAARLSGRLLQEALGGERLLHLGSRGDARLELLQRGPAAEIDPDKAAPVRDREKIGVRDREVVAGQVLLARELLVQPIELLLEVLRGVCL